MTTPTTVTPTLDELMNLAVGDPKDLFFEPDRLIVSADGQILRIVVNGSQFCSLDHITELADEFGDPENLAIRHEAELGHPLAFDKYYR